MTFFMAKIRLNSFPAPVLNRKYEIGGQLLTLRDYLNTNFYNKNTGDNITANQVRQIINLDPGDSTEINSVAVKRIS
jgi:hypothetical protein